MEKKDSIPVQFMQLAWKGCCKDGAHCWEKINNSMQEAFAHCVKYCFAFEPEDIEAILAIGNSWRSSWLYENWDTNLYRQAIVHTNPSAIRAFEHYLKIESPFWGHNVHLAWPGLHASMMNREKERLCPGFDFEYEGEVWHCNSFPRNDLGQIENPQYLNAMSGKKRKKFTREMFNEERKRKE